MQFGYCLVISVILLPCVSAKPLLSVYFYVGAGADFVMLGGMFAGHDQSGKFCSKLSIILV